MRAKGERGENGRVKHMPVLVVHVACVRAPLCVCVIHVRGQRGEWRRPACQRTTAAAAKKRKRVKRGRKRSLRSCVCVCVVSVQCAQDQARGPADAAATAQPLHCPHCPISPLVLTSCPRSPFTLSQLTFPPFQCQDYSMGHEDVALCPVAGESERQSPAAAGVRYEDEDEAAGCNNRPKEGERNELLSLSLLFCCHERETCFSRFFSRPECAIMSR